MGKRIYISADYDQEDGDRTVVDLLHDWADDNWHKVDYTDMALVVSGSVSSNPDCRPCDLKKEFNSQMNFLSIAVFVVGDKTARRMSGSSCARLTEGTGCRCTPYKQNTNGARYCKWQVTYPVGPNDDVGCVNSFSYLRHEFEQAKKKNKKIVIFYNSTRYEESWLPDYMKGYENNAYPFWKMEYNKRVANYELLKRELEYD